jgi:hypothetical protein
MPLQFWVDKAANLAANWQVELAYRGYIDEASRPLHVVIDSTVHWNGRVARIMRQGREVAHFPVGLRIYAGGAGREITCLADRTSGACQDNHSDHFRSERFWESDDFESIVRNPRLNNVRPPVFISGGSDGALQDFIRVVTGQHSARAVLGILPRAAQILFAESARSPCDHESRSWVWGDDTGACAAARVVEESIIESIADAYEKRGFASRMDRILRSSVNRPTVCLAHPLMHFENRYLLNRLLALLLLKHSRRRNLRIIRMPLLRLTAVDPAPGHVCSHNPKRCRSHMHVVHFQHMSGEPETRCQLIHRRPRGSGYLLVSRLIIRHGIRPSPPWANAHLVRQAPPYYVTE